MDREIRQRLKWVQMYEATGNAGLTCRRCGISRPTLRKWWKRYQAEGTNGLKSQSRRPHHSPGRRIHQKQEEWILKMRTERKLGVRRIKTELLRLHNFRASLATIHKVLKRHEVKPLKRLRRRKKVMRYQKDIPGERVQLDTCKVRPGIYLYTAIDDCTRCLAARVYSRRTSANTVKFLETYVSDFIFGVQRIQTDRGTEFTAMKVVEWFQDNQIKWRPIRPRSPHLNGKVERVQKTVLDELFATIDLDNLSLEEINWELEDWIDDYNRDRIHGSLGQPPIHKALDLLDQCPSEYAIISAYNPVFELHRNGVIGAHNEAELIELLKRSL